MISLNGFIHEKYSQIDYWEYKQLEIYFFYIVLSIKVKKNKNSDNQIRDRCLENSSNLQKMQRLITPNAVPNILLRDCARSLSPLSEWPQDTTTSRATESASSIPSHGPLCSHRDERLQRPGGYNQVTWRHHRITGYVGRQGVEWLTGQRWTLSMKIKIKTILIY